MPDLPPKTFKSAEGFKQALDRQLRHHATQRRVPLSTMQLKFVIERLLARLFREPQPPWLLKGGFAMDLRFRPQARTTKDIDLSVNLVTGGGPLSSKLRTLLQEAVDTDLGDFLTFHIGAAKRELTNAPAGGARYPCEAVLVGKVYARFHLDVGMGDAVIGTPEPLRGDDLLQFIGVPPPTVLAIPKCQQFAEKIHAYTFPWEGRQNTRTKDLVDLVVFLERGALNPAEVRAALEVTFTTRRTHGCPTTLAPPPDTWAMDFTLLAREANLPTMDYLEAFRMVNTFWVEHVQPWSVSQSV